jgi:ERCC4-type nuclease
MDGLENKGGEGSNQKKEEEEKEKDIELKTHQVILQLQIHNNKTTERKIVIIIDTREKNLFRYNLLDRCLKEMFPNETRLIYQKLDAGDITFTDMPIDEIKRGNFKQEDNKFPIVEVKTVDDLISTIGTQRDEQMDNMKQYTDNRLYLVEGCMEAAHKTIMIKAGYGRLNTLLIRDKFGVCKTDGYKQSVIFLLNIFISLEFMDEKRFKSEIKGKYIHVDSGKATKDPFVSMLCTIKGVSQRIAESIVEVYPTISDYINDHIELLLNNVNNNNNNNNNNNDKDDDDSDDEEIKLHLSKRVKDVNKSVSKTIYELINPKKILKPPPSSSSLKPTLSSSKPTTKTNRKTLNLPNKKRLIKQEDDEVDDDNDIIDDIIED